MIDSKVKVCGDDAGNVIIKSANNPEWGHIRVEQTRMVIEEDTGFAREKKLSALIPGKIKDLSGFGWEAGQEVAGKIVIREAIKPFNSKKPELDYKMAGNSGVLCKADGDIIYRKNIYNPNESAQDVLVAHTNKEEIQAAYAAQKEAGKLQPNSEFDL